MRSLRDQQSPTGSEMSDQIFGSRRGSLATYMMNDRRESLPTYQLSTAMPEPEPAYFGVSPDTTDGIGSIEFTREEDSGYYGVRSLRNNLSPLDFRNRLADISQGPPPTLLSPVTFEERYMPCYPVRPHAAKVRTRGPTTARTFRSDHHSMYLDPQLHARDPSGRN